MPIASQTFPLLSKLERSSILNCADEHDQPVPEVWCKLWDELYRETKRYIVECPRQHLARIALGMQEIGVITDLDAAGFKVRFAADSDGSLRDPWDLDDDDITLLPRLPALVSWPTLKSPLEFIEEMLILARVESVQRRRFWNEYAVDRMLDTLLINGDVADEVRRRLLDAHETSYLVDLETGVDMIYDEMRERLGALVKTQHAIARAKRRHR